MTPIVAELGKKSAIPDGKVTFVPGIMRRQHHEGVTGPVKTFAKTNHHAHFSWGVRHHVGHGFS